MEHAFKPKSGAITAAAKGRAQGRYFHGANKREAFFEGWYFKQQCKGRTLALIPAFHVDAHGKRSASIQIITNDGADTAFFSDGDFAAAQDHFLVQIGENTFSEEGLCVNLQTDRFVLQGKLRYTPFTPPCSNMMGPLRFVPFLQCNHGVLSMTHRVQGELLQNGKVLSFTGGCGYLEKDWGRSFPKIYLWTQCNWFDGQDCSVMMSLADIPLAGSHFVGCICAVWYGGREYRFATYQGVKILEYTRREVVLRQGDYWLACSLLEQNAHPLRAPQHGAMTRTIHESARCKVHYRLWSNYGILFDFISDEASFEFAGK